MQAHPTLASPTEQKLAPTRAQALVERDRAIMSPSYTRAYPFVMARGSGTRAWDVDGREYIDMTSGVATTATGHAHPRVVRAIQEQAELFIHMSGTDFFYEVEIELCERIAALMPGGADRQLFLTNSGTEAIEAALKLTRHATRRQHFMAFAGAFHGRSMGALSLTASKAIQRAGFSPLLPGVTHVPFPDPYRPPFGVPANRCAQAVIDYIEDTVFAELLPPNEVAAVFVEPILGEGGYVIPPPDFLPLLRALCDRHGILLVADEIQTGVGRTGKWWAVDHVGVIPDIICLAKAIASGLPLGAMVARRELMTWGPGAHGNTFGGNPLACAAALATLDVIEEEDLLANAARAGAHIRRRLDVLQTRHEFIGDVRGLGLMVAAELVTDRQTKQPARELRDRVVTRCFERGLLVLGCGRSTVRFMPALVITEATADAALDTFEDVLSEVVRAG
jgi:4-aminobutyrate aminotransferase